jgi:hypothetical protein
LQSLQARVAETNPSESGEAGCPVAALAADLDTLQTEIRSLYKAALPPAVIHQIARGAHEQFAIGRMMLDDCTLRSANGTLNQKHLANTRRWIAGVRRYMESRQTTYGTSIRRKFYVIKPARGVQ